MRTRLARPASLPFPPRLAILSLYIVIKGHKAMPAPDKLLHLIEVFDRNAEGYRRIEA